MRKVCRGMGPESRARFAAAARRKAAMAGGCATAAPCNAGGRMMGSGRRRADDGERTAAGGKSFGGAQILFVFFAFFCLTNARLPIIINKVRKISRGGVAGAKGAAEFFIPCRKAQGSA